MTGRIDDLLQPTVAESAPKRPLPWRVSSQLWVAFFGGVPAVTAIAYLNAGRLGASANKRRWILVAGIVALAVTMAVIAWFVLARKDRYLTRLAVRLVAVLLFLVLARIQRDDDRQHQVFGAGEYASLWRAGILATVLSAVLQVGLGTAVILLLQ